MWLSHAFLMYVRKQKREKAWDLTVGKESACNAGDPGLIPGTGRSPGEGNGSPLPVFLPENPTDRGAWQVIVLGSQRVGHD